MSNVLVQAWEATCRRNGARRAVVEAANGKAATFHELAQRAAAWRAAHLPEARALVGRAVVFAMPNGLDWLGLFLALQQAGAVVVPLDAGEPVAAQRRLADALRAGYWWVNGRLVPLSGARRYRDPAVCLIKLTSGSTSRPRPLVFTAGQLLADARQVTGTMGIGSRDLNYGLIPLGHSYGLGNLTIPLLAQGIPLVCGSAPLPHAIAADFARWRPTVFPGVPAMWRALTAANVALRGLRLGITAGAPLPPGVAREFASRFGRPLHSFYGSSETGGIAYDATGRATLAGGVGSAMSGVSFEERPGQRLRVSSAAVFTHGNRRRRNGRGVWIMPDRVAVNARGGLTLLGRRGTVVKIAGRRVNLGEVAARLRRLPEVGEVWVAVGPGAEPLLGAAVASRRSVMALREELAADTAAWKIPRRWVVLPELPVTARGKPDGPLLSAMIFGGAVSADQGSTPKSK